MLSADVGILQLLSLFHSILENPVGLACEDQRTFRAGRCNRWPPDRLPQFCVQFFKADTQFPQEPRCYALAFTRQSQEQVFRIYFIMVEAYSLFVCIVNCQARPLCKPPRRFGERCGSSQAR